MKEQAHSGRLFFLVIALIIVAFLPLVVVMSQQQQTYRSKAAEISPPPQQVVNTTTITTATTINLPKEAWTGNSQTLRWFIQFDRTFPGPVPDNYPSREDILNNYQLSIIRKDNSGNAIEGYQIQWDVKAGQVNGITSYINKTWQRPTSLEDQEMIAKKMKGALSSIFRAADFSGLIINEPGAGQKPMTPQQKETILAQTTQAFDNYINKIFADQWNVPVLVNLPRGSIVIPSWETDNFLYFNPEADEKQGTVGPSLTIWTPTAADQYKYKEIYNIQWSSGANEAAKIGLYSVLDHVWKYTEQKTTQLQIVNKIEEKVNSIFGAKDFNGIGFGEGFNGNNGPIVILDETQKQEIYVQLSRSLTAAKNALQ